MPSVAATLLITTALATTSIVAADPCPPSGYSRSQLLDLKAHEFRLADSQRVPPLALGLLPCLSSGDPVLRDGIAYDALSTWMRGKLVPPATGLAILNRLQPQIAPGFPEGDGFIRPFSALVLAEVARMDRIDPFMSDTQRGALSQAAASYLQSVRDYRGFDAKDGWRHGVAHGADLLMQLSRSQRIGKPDLDAFLRAVAAQIAPAGEHFYIYGEGERLALPVFFIAQRRVHSTQEWEKWLGTVAAPAPLANWSDAFQSQAGLAKRQNTVAFLQALYLVLQENGEPATKERLLKPLVKAIETVP